MKVRLCPIVVLGAAAAMVLWLSAAPAPAAQTLTAPFWPSNAAPGETSILNWRIWETRCTVRTSPTTLYTAADRLAVLRLWIGELAAQGVPVKDVVSREALSRLGQMAGQRDGDGIELPRAVDAAFEGLEALASSRADSLGAGEIRGRVVGVQGEPLAGVGVVLYGTPLGAVTAADGTFTIGSVPCCGTRWVVWAHKTGYLDAYAGRLSPSPGSPAQAELRLEPATPQNQYLDQPLVVRFARLVDVKQTDDPAQPIELAARAPDGYPDAVKPFLEPSPWIDSAAASVSAEAQQIAASVAEADRSRSAPVARAVFAWIVRSVALDPEHDSVTAPATAQWQLQRGAWGPTTGDWLRMPSEVLLEKRGNSAETARLAAALLRALGIAARPVTTWDGDACQWWVQLPAGNGYWVTTSLDALRSSITRTGKVDMQAALVCDDAVGECGVDERADIYPAWQSAAPLLWCVEAGEVSTTGRSAGGLASAQNAMASFARLGAVPGAKPVKQSGETVGRRGSPAYVVSWSGVVLDLHGQGATRQFTIRFPLGATNQWRTSLDGKHWTNHPEWVKAARRERHSNPRTGETMDWYCVDFSLGGQG